VATDPDRSSFARTLSALGSRIVLGELEPRSPLDVVEVGAEFGVSRTVVREVFRVLSAKGLVDARPKRGTIVSPRSEWQMLDSEVLRWRFRDGGTPQFLDQVFELRLAIEPMVARLAADRHDDYDLATLYEALGQMRSASTSEEHIAADLAFHQALLAAAHNELLEPLATLIEVGLRVRDRLVHSVINDNASDEHAAVLDAVRRRRPQAAETAMRALLTRSAADVERAIQAEAGQTTEAG
jgi:DNA-binding FadR family transcriptional regulator